MAPTVVTPCHCLINKRSLNLPQLTAEPNDGPGFNSAAQQEGAKTIPTTSDTSWGTIHPSALHHSAAMLRWTEASPRPHGALRYQCPVTGSLLLVTDEATLKTLAAPRGRIRCLACGEMHLLTQDSDAGDAALFVAGPAKP